MEGKGPKVQLNKRLEWERKGLLGSRDEWKRYGSEVRHIKGFKGTGGNIKGGKRRQEQYKWGEILEEPVWGDLKFPKEANEVPTRRQTKLVEHIVTSGSRRRNSDDREVPRGKAGSNRENREA